MATFRFHRLASHELAEAIAHYEEERPGLGAELLDEIERSLLQIGRFPTIAPMIRDPLRVWVIPRFPYSIVYRQVTPSRLRILAIAHQARRPGYWADRK